MRHTVAMSHAACRAFNARAAKCGYKYVVDRSVVDEMLDAVALEVTDEMVKAGVAAAMEVAKEFSRREWTATFGGNGVGVKMIRTALEAALREVK